MKRLAGMITLSLLIGAVWTSSRGATPQPLQLAGRAVAISHAEAEELARTVRAAVQRGPAPGEPARIRLAHQVIPPTRQEISGPTEGEQAPIIPAASAPKQGPHKSTSAPRPHASKPTPVPSRPSGATAPASTTPKTTADDKAGAPDYSRLLLKDAKRVGQGKNAQPAKAPKAAEGKAGRGEDRGKTEAATGNQAKGQGAAPRQGGKGRLHASPDEAGDGQQQKKGSKGLNRGRQGGFGSGQGPGKARIPGKQHGR